jgi:hypothetical protein
MEESNETPTFTATINQDREMYNGKTKQQANMSYRNADCDIIDQHDVKDNSKFLKSMTFTSVTAKCDCDECCNEGGIKRGYISTQIPQAINTAIQIYKRAKRSDELVKRSQVRSLIGRSHGLKDLAVWELTIPSLAEPLIEYGNPLVYRIIWINRLHKSLLIKQIGCGIIGSHTEEQRRQKLDWIENDVVVVSSNDQKAIGYVVEPVLLNDAINDAADENSCDTPPGPAVFYVAKVPSELLRDDESNRINDEILFNDNGLILHTGNSSMLFEIIRRICSRAVQALNNKNGGNSIRLDEQDQILFRKSITAMVKN